MDWTAGLTGIMSGINQGIDTSEKIKNSWQNDDQRKLKEEEYNAKMAPVADYRIRPEYQSLDAVGKQRVDAALAGKPVVRALDLDNVFGREVNSAAATKTLNEHRYMNQPIDPTKMPGFEHFDPEIKDWLTKNVRTQGDLANAERIYKTNDAVMENINAGRIKSAKLNLVNEYAKYNTMPNGPEKDAFGVALRAKEQETKTAEERLADSRVQRLRASDPKVAALVEPMIKAGWPATKIVETYEKLSIKKLEGDADIEKARTIAAIKPPKDTELERRILDAIKAHPDKDPEAIKNIYTNSAKGMGVLPYLPEHWAKVPDKATPGVTQTVAKPVAEAQKGSGVVPAFGESRASKTVPSQNKIDTFVKEDANAINTAKRAASVAAEQQRIADEKEAQRKDFAAQLSQKGLAPTTEVLDLIQSGNKVRREADGYYIRTVKIPMRTW